MIHILKNADFSECNLGKVTVPVEDTPESLLVISKFPNLSDTKKNKIKAFVNALVDSGIYGKLNYLMLPYFASTVGEAIQNVLLDENSIPSVKNMDKGVVTPNGLCFTGKGRVNIATFIKGTLSTTEFSLGGCLYIPNDVVPNGIATMGFMYTQPTGNNTTRIYWNKGLNINNGLAFAVPGINTTNNQNDSQSDCKMEILSVSISNAKVLSLQTENRIVEDSLTVDSFVEGSGLSINGQNDTEYHHYQSGYYRMLFAGSALTREEMSTIKDLMATLCDYA